MRRREFISLLGGAAVAWPLAARAQQSERMRRIGLLMLVGKADPQAHAELAAFTTELQRLGWTEGQNVRIDYRWADGDVSRLQALAAQLVELRPDLVVAQGSAALAASRQTTQTLPIVFADVTDPVGQGFVENSATAKPVTLPPGCARLATKPEPTGSAICVKTIGMLRVSCSSGCNASAVMTRITSGFRPTSSLAWVLMRSASPPPQR